MYLSTATFIYDDSKVDVPVCAFIIRNSIPNVIKTGLVYLRASVQPAEPRASTYITMNRINAA